jgi:hypothetical protein
VVEVDRAVEVGDDEARVVDAGEVHWLLLADGSGRGGRAYVRPVRRTWL